MLRGSQPPNPLTDNRLREDIVKELDRRARSDTDQHGRRVRPSRSDLWELQVRLLDEAAAALDHRRIHLAPAVLAWHTRVDLRAIVQRADYEGGSSGPLIDLLRTGRDLPQKNGASPEAPSPAPPDVRSRPALPPQNRPRGDAGVRCAGPVLANVRATHANTPKSVGGPLADRVTPCPTPIGNGPSSTLESSYTTSSACLTTTRQASRYGDRPQPTRQPSNKRMARDFRDPGGRRANSGGSHAIGLASDGVR
jgi:hypothetical protein